MEVTDLESLLTQVFGKLFSHALREGRDQSTEPLRHRITYLTDEMGHLPSDRVGEYRRVYQSGGAYDLLHHLA